FGVMTRKNAVVALMGVELILNAANLNLIAFSKYTGTMNGVMFSVFVIVLAAAEAAIALAIVLNIYSTFRTVDLSEIDTMRE
ncbi:MAG: NADH-quinone oxidoreductase subunit NuoK, partial [Candidatus Thermochlorobacter sp.]